MNSIFKIVSLSVALIFGSFQMNQVLAQDSIQVTSLVPVDSSIVEEGEMDPIEAIMHHIQDANEFQIWGDIIMPLPVMIRKSDGAWAVGLSSDFEESKGGKDGLVLSHGKIVNADTHDTAGFIDFSITKNVFMMILSVIILTVMFFSIKNAYTKRGVNSAPKGLQSFMEPIVAFMIDDVAKPNLGKNYEKFLPYILSVFFFILINNLLGLVPFFPGGANLTGNIAVTLTLAIITFIITNVSGTKSYWKHIFAMPGLPKPLLIIITPIEIIGMFTKPFALMIRLFANMTAGHVIVLSLISMIFILGGNGESIGGAVGGTLVAVPFVLFMNALELLVAFIQAYIFALLSAIFIGMALEEDTHVEKEIIKS